MFEMKIAIFYEDHHENDAQHYREVIQNELLANRIPFERKGKDLLRAGDVSIFVKNVDKHPDFLENNTVYDKVYASPDLLKSLSERLTSIAKETEWIPYPTQAVVELVLLCMERVDIQEQESELQVEIIEADKQLALSF